MLKVLDELSAGVQNTDRQLVEARLRHAASVEPLSVPFPAGILHGPSSFTETASGGQERGSVPDTEAAARQPHWGPAAPPSWLCDSLLIASLSQKAAVLGAEAHLNRCHVALTEEDLLRIRSKLAVVSPAPVIG